MAENSEKKIEKTAGSGDPYLIWTALKCKSYRLFLLRKKKSMNFIF